MAHERYPLMAFTLGLAALGGKQLLAQGTIWHTGLAACIALLSASLVVIAVNHHWHHNL